VPAGTPKDITALLNRSVTGSLREPDMKERLATLGYDVVGSTPEEFMDRVKAEIEMWAKVIRAANIAPL
jgi:tripartite-type tricarboxylate transporter receptor subunit TctC